MAAIKTLALTSAILATLAAADGNGQVSLCTSDDCGYCPNSITTQGTGYPACVIYDRETVLGGYADQYPPSNNGIRMIDWSIPPQSNNQCKTIIRSPANTDDENCGYPLYGSTDGGCSALETKTTMMVQFCCGTGDCTAAGVEKRSAGVTSAVFYHEDGTPVMPLAVGYKGVDLMDVFLADMGFNASTILARHEDKLKKRDCDSYAPDGADYTKTGSVSYDVSGYICGDGTMTSITNTQETSETTSFSVSVSDPFGIIMASTSFSFEKSASQSHEYTFTPDAGSCGHVAWTPFYTCTAGTISGCDDGDQHGEACTAKRISDNQVDGVYHFVITD